MVVERWCRFSIFLMVMVVVGGCQGLVSSLGDAAIAPERRGVVRDASSDVGEVADGSRRRDDSRLPDSRLPADQAIVEFPGVGQPCPNAQCVEGAICFGGTCRRRCQRVEPVACNDKASSCAETESCRAATSFSDVCLPAAAQVGQRCGETALCAGGAVCVRPTEGAQPTCLKLCKYGCSGSTMCVDTTASCRVCGPR